jgi:hypothetical protein
MEAPTPTPARLWGDQWLRVSEKVLKGLNHQLSNRVASIEAMTAMLDPVNGGADEQIIRALNDEVSRLSTLMHLYRLMPSEPRAEPEPVRFQDVIPLVLELHNHHSDLRTISCKLHEDPAAEPVKVRPSALMRSLLVLLESVAGHATRAKSAEPISLTCSGDAQRVWIVLEGPSPTTEALPPDGGSLGEAVRGTLADAGGEISGERGLVGDRPRIRYELSLPTLRALRASAVPGTATGNRHRE